MRRITAQLALHVTTAARADGELLASFVTAGAEADFAELVRRHGPMVWGVCRRALPDHADAEDAFQAVFLVLLRRASRLTASHTVGPWLHRVAVWTARNVSRRNARRLARRVSLPDQLATSPTDPGLRLDLDEAILALPDKYRSPIVLCHLLGYSRAEAASRLGCPEGTLSAWLSRGLARLREKLGGLDPAKVLGVAAVSVPAGLSASVVRSVVASQVTVATTSAVSQLVEGVLHMFWVKKATAASVALFAVFALGMGMGLTARHGEGVAVAQVKGDDESPAKAATPPMNLDEEIAKLEAELRAAQAGLRASIQGVKLTEDKIALHKAGVVAPAERLNDQITLARFKENEAQATKKVLELNARLDKLKREREAVPSRANKLEDELARLRDEVVRMQVEFDAKQRERQARVEAILEELKTVRTVPKGHVELTLHGKARNFEFAIKETDAAGKEIGTVVVREPAMLARLLTRIKNDPTAPGQLRVVADAGLATNGYFTVGLKACQTAGFKTVKFTGYMPQNNVLPELKSDQKGEAPGFKRYDAAECDTASLIKDFETWMRTF